MVVAKNEDVGDREVRMDIQEGTTVTTAGDTISFKDIVLRNADLSICGEGRQPSLSQGYEGDVYCIG